MQPTTAPRSAGQIIVDYFRDFGVLAETRKEYWGIQIINFLDCTFYFAMLTIATVFLSEDLGLNDKEAGYATAVFTSATTLMLLVSGLCTDWLGIKRSLALSMTAMLVLRAAMVALAFLPGLPHRGLIASALFLLMAPFMAAIQTIFQSSCQRFTTRRSRSAGFNLWYLFMNIGAAAGGYAIDFVRLKLQVGNVHIFTLGVITAALCLVVGLTMVRREDQLVSPDEPPEEKEKEAKVERKNPWRIILDVFQHGAILRLLVLIALILGVRAVFTYLYLLMPKYWLRTIGPDAEIGALNMINPIGIVIGLILFIPITNKFKVFSMLVYGAMISAFALFPLAMPWELFSGNIADAHYIMALVCMVIVTIGEVIWSPKLNEYTAAIAPKGQEGTYLGLSLVPWFIAKTVVSLLSGHMLEAWSPPAVAMPATTITGEAQRLGYDYFKLGDNLSPATLTNQAPALGISLNDLAEKADTNAILARAETSGVDVATFRKTFKAESFKSGLGAYGIDLGKLPKDALANTDPAVLALALQQASQDAARQILEGKSASETVHVSLQFAMINRWVNYWHSPAAMWLILGLYAFLGCVIAAFLRGWLTKGARV
jgi:predicted MFS family arabinose efflux permease